MILPYRVNHRSRVRGILTIQTFRETLYVVQQVAAQERLPLRFFLSAGLYETGRDGRGILETSRELRDVLRLKGYPVDWRLYTGGHDYLVWRGALAEGMLALFGTGPE